MRYSKIKVSISNWDTLVVCGHWPHKIIMEECNLNTDLTFIVNIDTNYIYEGLEDEMHTIIADIYNDTIKKKFLNYKIYIKNKLYNLDSIQKIIEIKKI